MNHTIEKTSQRLDISVRNWMVGKNDKELFYKLKQTFMCEPSKTNTNELQ